MKNILIISRDTVFARCTQILLEDSGYCCSVSSEPPSDTAFYDSVIFDLETVKHVPVLCPTVCTAYSPTTEHESFLLRPFTDGELVELTARLCNEVQSERSETLTLDNIHRRVSFNGNSLQLTHREFELLSLLMSTDRAVSRTEIIEKVFAGTATGNADAVYINYLRKKLERLCGKNPIISVRGYGYRFKNN